MESKTTHSTNFLNTLSGKFNGKRIVKPVSIWLTIMLTVFMSANIWAQTQTFDANGTFTVPAGVTSVTVKAWGAGGGGGGSANVNNATGGGGGGGSYATKTSVAVVPGNTYSITVGSGGIGGINTGTNGTAGGFSTVTFGTNTITAAGGGGGTGGVLGLLAGTKGLGGSNGTSIGTIIYKGGDGANGSGGVYGGGGGGAAGSTDVGKDASVETAGIATTLNGGAGGNGTANLDGYSGLIYGGGGGGSGAKKQSGGTGAGGLIIISWTAADINDAPAGADKTVTTNEDTDYTFAAVDFGFTDPNDTPANTLLAVKITTLPASGILKLSGVVVVAADFIPVASIGNLTFSPAANANGSPYTTFTFQIQDNGGVLNGGVDLDQSANTITITVTAVNDAPEGADNTVTTDEDTDYTFAAVDFGFTDPN
ncbi:MAG: hypothetical protein Q8K04_00905, partial [Lutibacter sp.]|nr:hypothetical protein [Lutibacter sp.]